MNKREQALAVLRQALQSAKLEVTPRQVAIIVASRAEAEAILNAANAVRVMADTQLISAERTTDAAAD